MVTATPVQAQPSEPVRALVAQAESLQKNKPAEALRYSRQALEIAHEGNDRAGAAAARVAMAEALEALGGWDESLVLLNEAFDFYENQNDVSGQARVLDQRASVLTVTGKYTEALTDLQQAYELLVGTEDVVGQAEVLNSIGRLYYFQEDMERALTYFERSRVLHEQADNLEGVGKQLNNIGVMYRQTGEYDKALDAYSQSITIREKLGNLKDMAGTFNNIGVVHFLQGDYDKSLEWAHKALKVRQQVQYRLGEAQSFYNIGRTLVDIGRVEEGIDYLRQSLAITGELEALQLAQVTQFDLSDALARVGRHHEALAALHEAWKIRDQRFDLQRQRDIEAMNARFEISEREREFALLEEQRKRDALLRNVAIAGTVLLTLLAGLLYNGYRQKSRANQVIGSKNDELAALNHIVASINSQQDFDEMLSVLVRQAVEFVDKADRGAILILDKSSQQFRVASVHGYRYSEVRKIGLDYAQAVERYTGAGLRIAEGVHLHESLPPIEGHDEMHALDPQRSLIAMSITLEQRIEGFMVLSSSSDSDAFQTADAARFARIREHAISALSKARDLEKLKLENVRAEKALERMREAEAELKHAAMTDSLTGLPNRRYLMQRLKDEEARSRRNKKAFSLIMADIDHFKAINDEFGHDVGDEILAHVSRVLTETLRGQDVVCRWGGEEFMIMLPETEEPGALIAAEKLRAALNSRPCQSSGKLLTATMTFGVCEIRNDHEVHNRIKRADLALYQGKARGRNCVTSESEVVTPA